MNDSKRPEEKLKRWNGFAQANGLDPNLINSSLDRWLRRARFNGAPFIFWPSLDFGVVSGVLLGLIFGIVAALFDMLLFQKPIESAILKNSFSMVIFGSVMALYALRRRKKMNLPPWDQI